MLFGFPWFGKPRESERERVREAVDIVKKRKRRKIVKCHKEITITWATVDE